MNSVIEENEFYIKMRDKLIEENLISISDNISFKKIYSSKQRDMNIYHYLVTIEHKQQKLFIRTIKEKDYSYAVMSYLIKLNNSCDNIQFPTAIVKPFTIDQHTYIVTSYLDGEDLDTLMPTMSNEKLLQISDLLNNNLKLIHSINNSKYSDKNQFSSALYDEIMFNKLYIQFHNEMCINHFMKNRDINKLLIIAKNILSDSTFSKPTLIHMDIKPKNIIISPQGQVHLIDFELSRFGDLDYEWTNLLVKTFHSYEKRFKQYILQPIIEKNFLPLEKAMEIDKYKIYILYLSINIYIYYLKCDRRCPLEIVKLINTLLKQLSDI